VVPWPDGTTLVGATVEDVGFDERATVAGVTGLLDAAREVLPAVTRAHFEAVRVGLRPATADDLPIVGWSHVVPKLLYATGHYRNGVLLAPLTARLVADLVLDATPDPLLDTLAPGRFETAATALTGASVAGSDT
jgi:glycine/D-amino acid oxidase-like deaminating enzyme